MGLPGLENRVAYGGAYWTKMETLDMWAPWKSRKLMEVGYLLEFDTFATFALSIFYFFSYQIIRYRRLWHSSWFWVAAWWSWHVYRCTRTAAQRRVPNMAAARVGPRMMPFLTLFLTQNMDLVKKSQFLSFFYALHWGALIDSRRHESGWAQMVV